MSCKNCAHPILVERNQVFRNGSVHLRIECEKCGSFSKWATPAGRTSIKQELYDIVKNLAVCESQSKFSILKLQARQLMDRVHRPHLANVDEQLPLEAENVRNQNV